MRAAYQSALVPYPDPDLGYGSEAVLFCCSDPREHDVGEGAARFARDEAASESAEGFAQAALLRDVFGPLPFRPVVVAPSVLAWNDRLVVRLAKAIYDQLRWSDMGVLADALLDAGCDDDGLLAHLRLPGPHTRGCFVLDLLLGRE